MARNVNRLTLEQLDNIVELLSLAEKELKDKDVSFDNSKETKNIPCETRKSKGKVVASASDMAKYYKELVQQAKEEELQQAQRRHITHRSTTFD